MGGSNAPAIGDQMRLFEAHFAHRAGFNASTVRLRWTPGRSVARPRMPVGSLSNAARPSAASFLGRLEISAAFIYDVQRSIEGLTPRLKRG
jgi:hypothetical protein